MALVLPAKTRSQPAGIRCRHNGYCAPVEAYRMDLMVGITAGVGDGIRRPGNTTLLNLATHCYFFSVVAPAPALPYLRRNRSTRPAVSTSFCLPVKNG